MAKAKKLPSGNWRVNLYDYTDPATGKRIYKSFTATTKKEAEYMAAEYKLDGKQRTASVGDMTLKEAYTRYDTRVPPKRPERPTRHYAAKAARHYAGGRAALHKPVRGKSCAKNRAQCPWAFICRAGRILSLFPALHGLAPEAKGKDHHSDRGGSEGIAGGCRGH